MKKTTTKKFLRKSLFAKGTVIATAIAAMMISGCGGNSSDSSVLSDSSDLLSSSDSSFVSSYEEEEKELVYFEGVKLSKLTQLTLNEYIDFTIPYTWTFGRVDEDEESVKEAIAVTGDNAVMTIYLKNINVSDKNKLVSEEIDRLKNTYPEYDFKKSDLFENDAAVIEGMSNQGDVKMYIAVIPEGEESVWVTYAYKSEGTLAKSYFDSAISEMLQKK